MGLSHIRESPARRRAIYWLPNAIPHRCVYTCIMYPSRYIVFPAARRAYEVHILYVRVYVTGLREVNVVYFTAARQVHIRASVLLFIFSLIIMYIFVTAQKTHISVNTIK